MSHLKRSFAIMESNRKKTCLHQGEIVQGSAEDEMILQRSAEDAGQFFLPLLPNEILFKIYNYLSPADLISIVKLDDKRLTELTYTVRQADFSSCRTASPVFIHSFFSRDRVKLIQKLNFNHYFYLKPHEMSYFICRCKNLKSLSVVGCHLTSLHICHILEHCEQLEELAWNVTAIPLQVLGSFPSLKKLYLFCELMSDVLLRAPFLKCFPQIEQVWVDFDCDCNNLALPFVGMWSITSTVSDQEKSKHLMIMASKSMYTRVSGLSGLFPFNCAQVVEQLFGRMDLSVDSPKSRFVSIPPYLQFRSNVEDIQSVSLCPSKAYSTLVILVTDEFLKMSESVVKCVQEIVGDKLKRLSFVVHNFKRESFLLVQYDRKDYASNCDKTCDVMKQLFLTSKYITVLNLTSVHFHLNSPIKAITQLQYLEVLNLPSCAFRSDIRENDSKNLSSVVSACAEIKEFVLYCCAALLTSDDLVCIQNWSRLEHLSIIYSAIVVRSFAFLQRVADSCLQLSSLSLIALPSSSASIFTNDVIYLLRKARNLRFIRINDVNFNPVFERFWPAIGGAVGLEGICITAKPSVHVPTRVVLSQIKKLKYLHLFHFQARVSNRFMIEVKKSMQMNGVLNGTCEEDCTAANDPERSALQLGMYHRRPGGSECLRLHLKDIDMF